MSITMRPIQALRLWQAVTLAEVHDDAPDLSMRQMAILLTIYLDPPPHTVRGLAAWLGVTKPVITRALDTMGAKKLVWRHRDENDRRNVLVKRTVEGALYVERLGDMVIAKAKELLMTGDLLTAKEAVGLGLINYAVPAAELDAKVDEMVGKLLANPKWAVRWTKTAANIPLRALAAQMMDASIGWESVSNYLDDRREAVMAFKEKRPPNLTGD